MPESPALPSQEWTLEVPILGLKINRTALELGLFCLGVGIIVGANVGRAAERAVPCPDCERTRAEHLEAVREGGRRYLEGRGETQGEGVAGSDLRGPIPAEPPAAPSPSVSKDEPPAGSFIVTEEGGIFPEIPADPYDPIDSEVPEIPLEHLHPLFRPEER